MERTGHMAFAAGALVFPGGRIDAADHEAATLFAGFEDAAARIAAVRETIEETGIVPAISPAPGPAMAQALRQGIVQDAPFGSLLAAQGLSLDLDALTPFARWCPNFREARRFDTLFFLAEAPAGEAGRRSQRHRRRARLLGQRGRRWDEIEAGAPTPSFDAAISSGWRGSTRSPRRADAATIQHRSFRGSERMTPVRPTMPAIGAAEPLGSSAALETRRPVGRFPRLHGAASAGRPERRDKHHRPARAQRPPRHPDASAKWPSQPPSAIPPNHVLTVAVTGDGVARRWPPTLNPTGPGPAGAADDQQPRQPSGPEATTSASGAVSGRRA